jgi:hypothetical protein
MLLDNTNESKYDRGVLLNKTQIWYEGEQLYHYLHFVFVPVYNVFIVVILPIKCLSCMIFMYFCFYIADEGSPLFSKSAQITFIGSKHFYLRVIHRLPSLAIYIMYGYSVHYWRQRVKPYSGYHSKQQFALFSSVTPTHHLIQLNSNILFKSPLCASLHIYIYLNTYMCLVLLLIQLWLIHKQHLHSTMHILLRRNVQIM